MGTIFPYLWNKQSFCKAVAMHVASITTAMVLILLSLLSCTSNPSITTDFNYSLRQEHLDRNTPDELFIEVYGDSISFRVIFQGGGGENESARLRTEDGTLRIMLINVDHKAEKMLVQYIFSGTVSGIKPNRYLLQIEDSTGRLVAEEEFSIK